MTCPSSEQPLDSSGRAYHIGLARGDVAPSIVLVGDPARAERCAGRFDSIDGNWSHREFCSWTGTFKGIPVTVMATGIGSDNTEIAIVELSSVIDDATVIRAGTCGGLQPTLELGDLVISWGAVRLENTSLAYVPPGYPAAAHPDVLIALRDEARESGHPHHVGMTATAAGFYGAQGRDLPHFPAVEPNLEEHLARIGVLNFEMETSALFTLAALRNWRAGAVCTVFAQRHHQHFVEQEDRSRFEDRCVDTALGALLRLSLCP
ncbi:MAG TPA: uridine phosphorylase [Planctomycetes bacterium]|nr:uridine phosphorylase [Planctomycetota bacterium]